MRLIDDIYNIFFLTKQKCRLNENNEPVLNAGFELTISVRGSIPGDTSLSEADNTVVTAVRETIDALLAGKLV